MGMYRTEVLREFQFPESANFRFVTEGLIWNRISTKYRSRFLNRVTGYKEYLPGGLSQQNVADLILNSAPSLLYHTELLRMRRRLPLATQLRSAANYTRLSLHQKVGMRQLLIDAPRKLLFVATLPLGLLLYLRDRFRTRPKSTSS